MTLGQLGAALGRGGGGCGTVRENIFTSLVTVTEHGKAVTSE